MVDESKLHPRTLEAIKKSGLTSDAYFKKLKESMKKNAENRIYYQEGEWVGEFFGEHGEIILKGTEVIYFTMKNRKFNTLEGLTNQVKAFIWLDEHKDEIKENYRKQCEKERSEQDNG